MASFLFSAASLLGLSGRNTISSRKHFSGITIALACLAYAVVVTGADPPVVQLGRTSVIGTLKNAGLEFFGGIPYAEPPVGRLRFERPVLKPHLDVDTFDATKFGVNCMQPGFPEDLIREDCLLLNIFRPVGSSPDSQFPVMLWSQGGGFSYGPVSTYDGDNLVEQSVERRTPIIYVDLNYRVGAFGFLSGQGAEDARALNLGLLDVRTALEWVQLNIASFGGDKDKVTFFGESAGAVMISDLGLNGKLNSLCRAVATTIPLFHAKRNQKCFDALVAGVPDCADSKNPFECLKSVDANILLEASNTALWEADGFCFALYLDGDILTNLPSKLNVGQTFSDVAMFMGTNLDEGTSFTPDENCDEYLTKLYTPSPKGPKVLKSAIDQIEALYPDDPSLGSPYGTGNQTFGHNRSWKKCSSIIGDLWFQAPARYLREQFARNGRKSYAYIFDDEYAGDPGAGVYHSSELPYIFGYQGDPAQKERLAAQMRDYWLSFANSLDPNDGKGTRRPRWEPYTKDNPVLMRLNSKHLGLIPDNIREEQIKYLNQHASTFSR